MKEKREKVLHKNTEEKEDVLTVEYKKVDWRKRGNRKKQEMCINIMGNMKRFVEIFLKTEKGKNRAEVPLSLFMIPFLNKKERKTVYKKSLSEEPQRNRIKWKRVARESRIRSQCVESIFRTAFKRRAGEEIEEIEKIEEDCSKNKRQKKKEKISIRNILDRISEETLRNEIEKKEDRKNRLASKELRSRAIPVLLSGLQEVPLVSKTCLETAPAKIRARIFREGVTRQNRRPL